MNNDPPPFPVERRDQIIMGHERRLNLLDRDIRDIRAMIYAWGFITFMIGVVALLLP